MNAIDLFKRDHEVVGGHFVQIRNAPNEGSARPAGKKAGNGKTSPSPISAVIGSEWTATKGRSSNGRKRATAK